MTFFFTVCTGLTFSNSVNTSDCSTNKARYLRALSFTRLGQPWHIPHENQF